VVVPDRQRLDIFNLVYIINKYLISRMASWLSGSSVSLVRRRSWVRSPLKPLFLLVLMCAVLLYD
jgi:hypothetical protein